MLCKDHLRPLAPEWLLKCLSVLTSKHSPSTTRAFGCPEQRANPGCLAVRTGRLAHGEDERSQLHGFVHAWGHATEGERVHYERVQIWRKVNAFKYCLQRRYLRTGFILVFEVNRPQKPVKPLLSEGLVQLKVGRALIPIYPLWCHRVGRLPLSKEGCSYLQD